MSRQHSGTAKSVFGLSVLNNRFFIIYLSFSSFFCFSKEYVYILCHNSLFTVSTSSKRAQSGNDSAVGADENAMCCLVRFFAYLPLTFVFTLTLNDHVLFLVYIPRRLFARFVKSNCIYSYYNDAVKLLVTTLVFGSLKLVLASTH